MPGNLVDAVERASDDNSVHVIVITGAGRGFCGGYDLNVFAEAKGDNPVIQEMPWDAMIDYRFMRRCTDSFMSLWRCPKPVIAKVNGDAVAGGSDIALVRRYGCHDRNRTHRLPTSACLGLPDHSDVGVSSRCGTRQAYVVHR